MRKWRFLKKKPNGRKKKRWQKRKGWRKNKKQKKERTSRGQKIRHGNYGDYAEWIAGQTLAALLQEKRISGYVKNDRQGIDFDIKLLDGTTVYWQIKSSERGCVKHHKKYPRIPCSSFDRRTQKKDEHREDFVKRLVQKAKHDIIELFQI